MGFFSSAKPPIQEDVFLANAGNDSGTKSVVQVIRSRFYGKNKGKERSHSPLRNTTTAPESSRRAPTSTATTATNHRSVSQPHGKSGLSPGSLAASSPYTPLSSSSPPPSPIHRPRKISRPKQLGPMSPSPVPAHLAKKSTDPVTMTLAVRLNELAVANSEGLLSDDEYRLLRGDLFERFASNAAVPSEQSIVPVARHTRGTSENTRTSLSSSRTGRPSSNFQVNVSRTPSVASKTSVTSGMTSLFRRATGSNDYSNDAASTFSVTSNSSNTSKFRMFSRLGRKSSNSSIRTDVSMSSPVEPPPRRRAMESSGASMRSASGRKHSAAPPSSFPSRVTNAAASPASLEMEDTTGDILREIRAVETEEKRLIDAFNGLELTALTRKTRRPATIVDDTSTWYDGASTDTLTQAARARRNAALDAEDTLSMRSGTTSYSYTNSPKRPRHAALANSTVKLGGTTSRSNSLRRKTSMSSVGSQPRSVHSASMIPPVPSLPVTLHPNSASSSTNLSSVGSSSGRSSGHLPLITLDEYHKMRFFSEEEEDGRDKAVEMEDIRRRRAEVAERYEEKLSYLRAKLKAKELAARLK